MGGFSAVPYARLELLPTDTMPWERLEILLRKTAHDVEGLRQVQIYGVRGQSQHGIDVVGVAADGSRHALQGKRYTEFTKADLTAAVDKFIAERGDIPFSISRLIVATGCLADRKEITNELYRLQQAHSDVGIELWHQRSISDRLRDRPDIVVEFFGDTVAQAFCLPVTPHVVPAPPPDRVDLADALLRGPAAITGAERHLAEAARVEATDPVAAVNELDRAGQLLEAGGFTAHASVVLERRATLLARAGDHDRAARLLSGAFWRTLAVYQDDEADNLSRQLNTVAATETSRALARIAAIALDVLRHPLGSLPAFSISDVRGESTHMEVARLLILIGENSAANPGDTWRQDNIENLRTQADLVGGHGADGAELACRLQIEAADVTGDWTNLLDLARRNRLPRAHSVIVFARHALYHAERSDPESANLSWEDAMTQACLDGQNDAAAEYVFSREILRTRYRGPSQNDHHRLVRSLRAMGDRRQAAAERLEEKAMRALLEDKPHVAVPLLRAFHRAAHSSGAWGQVTRARQLLADTYRKTNEPLLAAKLYALAGQPKQAGQLAKEDPNRYLDVRECMSSPAYWVAGTGYRMLAEQADLVPDDHVAEIGTSALDVLDEAQVGTLRDTAFFDSSVWLNAVKALASLAERLPLDQALRLLDYMRPWVPRRPNSYRHTDDDQVRACVGIATAHPQLRSDAVDQLMGLLAANDSGVSSSVERAASNLVQGHPDLMRDRLTAMAAQHNQYAARLLKLITDEPSADQLAVAAAAAAQLRTPPDSTSESVGIGTGAPDQALLAASLPAAQRRELAREQLTHARWPYEPGHNRAEYYDAARILAHDLEEVDDLFEDAVVLANDRSASYGDILNNLGNHPLSTFRTIGLTIDTRPHALFLAAALARTQEQKDRVRELAYTLIGSSDHANWYVTQTLKLLNNDNDRALPLLATQPHWALRSLAALTWAHSSTAAPETGRLLAKDADPRVRRALASALATSPVNPTTAELRQHLAEDPCYSVRRLILPPT